MKTVVVYEEPGEGLSAALYDAITARGAGGTVRLAAPATGYPTSQREADAAVISPMYRGGTDLTCSILVMPDGGIDCGVDACEIVTYGMNPRATLSFSSVTDGSHMLEVRREIVTLDGERIDECELAVPPEQDAERGLAVCGVLALCGLLST